jgi:hypothetical protein
VERSQGLASGDLLGPAMGLGQRLLGPELAERVRDRLPGVCPSQGVLDELDRRGLALPDGPGRLHGGSRHGAKRSGRDSAGG